MGTALRPRPAAAARVRGPGAGPLVCAHRAVPAAVRRGQHDRRTTVDPGVVLPPAPPTGLGPSAEAAHRVLAEGDAPAPSGDERGRGLHDGHVRARAGRPPDHRQGCRPPGRAALRQGAPRPARRGRQARDHRRRARPPRAARAAPPRPHPRGAGRLPGRRRRVGTGGAGEPGRLAVRLHEPVAAPGRPTVVRRGPLGECSTGHRVVEALRTRGRGRHRHGTEHVGVTTRKRPVWEPDGLPHGALRCSRGVRRP
ncbi:hypothetical protein CURTO8I2_280112 [Curtobacterium sp. 8I-2]|nr:hypothetical protein CURTO8I2_280112 [Curtobacterium sp. 8I-2]